MKYRALVNFTGVLNMVRNEIKEINNENLVKDLLQAKYIEEVKEVKEDDTKSKPNNNTKHSRLSKTR